MKTTAHEIALRLESAGFGTFASQSTLLWSINVSIQPDAPNNTITVYDTGGLDPDTDELDLKRPTFQVRVRSLHYQDAATKIQEIARYLIFQRGVMGDHNYVTINQESEFLDIGSDDNDRAQLTCNFRAIKNEV